MTQRCFAVSCSCCPLIIIMLAAFWSQKRSRMEKIKILEWGRKMEDRYAYLDTSWRNLSLIAFGKPAGHREAAPRVWCALSGSGREKQKRREEERRGEETKREETRGEERRREERRREERRIGEEEEGETKTGRKNGSSLRSSSKCCP